MTGNNVMLSRPTHGGNLVWAAQLAQCAPHELLDFSASINPLGPPESAIAAIQAGLTNLRHYPDPNYTELCQAIAAHHNCSPDWILPGNGAAELLTWAAWDLAQLDYTVLPVPAFSDYGRALQALDTKVLRLSVLNDAQTLNALTPHGRAGLLVNNPHNPTGGVWARSQLETLIERYELVVIDEAFMDFLGPEGEQKHSFLAALTPGEQDKIVVLRSLTKFYSVPGLRLGYAVGHPERLRRWQQRRDPWSVNSLAAAAGVAMLQDAAFAQQTWDWLPEARQHLFEGLNQFAAFTPYPGAANFLLVATTVPTTTLQAKLLQRDRLLIRDCVSFPELGEGYFRVAVRTIAENQRLIEACQQLFVEGIIC